VTGDWISRKNKAADVHGPGMSYCFGCKQDIDQFNETVANCKGEEKPVIEARESDNSQTSYRGHVIRDGAGNCTVADTGGGRWAGLDSNEHTTWKVAGRPLSHPFNPANWSGIDCSGLVEKAVNSGRDAVGNVKITIPRGSGLTGSQGFFAKQSYVFLTSATTANEHHLRKGDLVRYDRHVTVVHDDPDPHDNYMYKIIHAFGNSNFDDDDDRSTPKIFSRKVMVTRHEIKTRTGFGRIKLWD
jgi:hypothetical protein